MFSLFRKILFLLLAVVLCLFSFSASAYAHHRGGRQVNNFNFNGHGFPVAGRSFGFGTFGVHGRSFNRFNFDPRFVPIEVPVPVPVNGGGGAGSFSTYSTQSFGTGQLEVIGVDAFGNFILGVR